MEEEKTLHDIFADAVNIKDLDYELPVAITNQGYFRVTRNCYLKVYLSVKNYKISNIYLEQRPNTYACKIYLHKNFIFDSATIPWPVRWAIPEVGRHSLGAAFHDLLYRSAGLLTFKSITLHKDWLDIKLDQKFADDLFALLNEKMNVKPWRQNLLNVGVRLGGHFTFDKYLKSAEQNSITAGTWVKGRGFAYSNFNGTAMVKSVFHNIAILSDGDIQLLHSLKPE
jgi:hypothetical protein